MSPLHLAARHSAESMVKFLLSQGVDVNALDEVRASGAPYEIGKCNLDSFHCHALCLQTAELAHCMGFDRRWGRYTRRRQCMIFSSVEHQC